jgi:hypothetical protein
LVADLREERRLRVFENRVLRRISGLRREDVTGEWKKLHNKGPHNVYSSSNIVLVIKSNNEMDGACSADGVWERRVQDFGWKP